LCSPADPDELAKRQRWTGACAPDRPTVGRWSKVPDRAAYAGGVVGDDIDVCAHDVTGPIAVLRDAPVPGIGRAHDHRAIVTDPRVLQAQARGEIAQLLTMGEDIALRGLALNCENVGHTFECSPLRQSKNAATSRRHW